jgi:hypothetical protein
MGSLSPLTQYQSGNLPLTPYKGKEGDSGTPDAATTTPPTKAEDIFTSPTLPTNKPQQEATKFAGARSLQDQNIFKQFWEWLSKFFNKNGSAREKYTLNQTKTVYEKDEGSDIKKKRNWTQTLINTGIKIATIGTAVALAVTFRESIGSTFSKLTPNFIQGPVKRVAGWITHITPNRVKEGCSNISDFTCTRVDTMREETPKFAQSFFRSFLKG